MAGPSGAQVVAEFKKFTGDPYVYGDAGPSAFDCSGLVQYALERLGLHGVPRTSEQQYAWVTKVTKAQLQPGDLVFTQWPGDNAPPGHVQVYIGGGQVLGADTPAQGVAVTPLSGLAGHIVGYGRPPGVAGGTAAGSSAPSGGFSLLSLPADVLDMFSTAEQFVSKLMWLVNPENWARIIAGAAGAFLLVFGLGFLIAAAV